MKQYKTLACFLIFAFFELTMLGWSNNDILTIGFLAIIFSVLLVDAIFNRKKLINLTASLVKATGGIKTYRSLPELFALEVKEKNIFDNKYLNECLVLYIEDSKANIKDGWVDITDYINREMIHIRVNKNVSSQISGVMTALGILGTFIGLTFGLQKFDINSDTVGLTTNITTLMNGIKIAFHTSILGIIASVCHSYFLNKDLDKLDRALIEFYSEFDKLIPDPQVTATSKLLEYQSKQTIALEKLSDNISEGIADRMAIAITETVLPAMESISKTLDSYIKETVDSQTETLNRIVSEFMNSLNSALDDQFKSLAVSIDKMCTWQGATTENIGQITALLTPVVENLKEQRERWEEITKNSEEIGKTTEYLLHEMKLYSDTLMNSIKVVQNVNVNACAYLEKAAEYNADQQKYLEKSEASVTALVEQIAKSEQLNDKIQSSIITTAETVKKFVEFNKHEKETSFIYQATLQKKLTDATQITDILVTKMTNYIDAVNEITEGHKNIIESTNRLCNMLSSENEMVRNEYIKLTDEFKKRNNTLIDTFIATKDETLNQLKALSKNIDLISSPVLDMLKTQDEDEDEIIKEDDVNDEA